MSWRLEKATPLGPPQDILVHCPSGTGAQTDFGLVTLKFGQFGSRLGSSVRGEHKLAMLTSRQQGGLVQEALLTTTRPLLQAI